MRCGAGSAGRAARRRGRRRARTARDELLVGGPSARPCARCDGAERRRYVPLPTFRPAVHASSPPARAPARERMRTSNVQLTRIATLPETPMAQHRRLIAHLDELLDPGAFDDYGPNGLQVPGRDARSRRVVTGVSRAARAVRARASSWAPSSCSSTTACSGTSTRPGSTPRARRAPAAAVQARHRPRRLPPAARRATPRSATTRCSPRALGCEATRAVRRPQAARRSACRGASPTTASRPPSWSRACARRPGASRSLFAAGPERDAHDRHRLRRRRRLRSTRRSRAGLDAFLTGEPREHVDGRRARGAASTSSPPATTRRRRSACARWATAGRALRRRARLRRRPESGLSASV